MRKPIPLLILSGLGAACLAAFPGGGQSETPPDRDVVDRYLVQLSPAPAGAEGSSQGPAESEKLAKTAQKLERAEPMLGAVLNGLR